MTKLAYVCELRWRWVNRTTQIVDVTHDGVPMPDQEPVKTRVQELGYWCDGEWHAVPTEEPTDE